MLDLSEITLIADYFVIATADSERQLKAIAEELVEQLKAEFQMASVAVEGTPASGWVLIDLHSIVVHLFLAPVRQRYQLENLWKDARVIVRVA